jgi:SnoaL-like domain
MTEVEAESFVAKFKAAWDARDGNAFLALWHPEGQLHYPFANRVIKGNELGKLQEIQTKQAPALTWRLLGWTLRNDVVVIEWESSNVYGTHTLVWRGVDKITLRDGRIIEEVVYSDTAPLQAMRAGKPFPALMQLPDSLLA